MANLKSIFFLMIFCCSTISHAQTHYCLCHKEYAADTDDPDVWVYEVTYHVFNNDDCTSGQVYSFQFEDAADKDLPEYCEQCTRCGGTGTVSDQPCEDLSAGDRRPSNRVGRTQIINRTDSRAKNKVTDEFIVRIKNRVSGGDDRWFYLQVVSKKHQGVEIVTSRTGYEIEEPPRGSNRAHLIRYDDPEFEGMISFRNLGTVSLPNSLGDAELNYVNVGPDRFAVRIFQ